MAVVKRVARSVVRAPRDQRGVVLIFGCQRSGTTMLQQTVLDRSWRVLILEEHDRRLVGAHHEPGETAWQDYATVVGRLRRVPFELVVAKPLVESDRAIELMDAAEPVKAIWMLRHYYGVARSNIKRFGLDNPYRDLQPFCEDDPLDWRCRGAAKETRETVIELMSAGLSALDAAALFWWARNQLYFEQQLWHDGRMRILRYERACNRPEEVVEALSDYVGIALPLHSIASKVRPQLDGREVADLHPDVERLCRETWDSFAGLPEL
jgi:Sulfotransferase domain